MPPSAWRDPEHTLLPAVPLHSSSSGFAHLLSFRLSCIKTSCKNISNQCLFPSFSRHTLAMCDVNVMGNQVRADRIRSSVYYLYYFSVDPKLFQNIKCVILCFFLNISKQKMGTWDTGARGPVGRGCEACGQGDGQSGCSWQDGHGGRSGRHWGP